MSGGDAGTWTRTKDGQTCSEDSPVLLAERKAKALLTLLKSQQAVKKVQVPWLDAVVFLSADNIQCDLTGPARNRVLLQDRAGDDEHPERKGILAALLNREGPGIDPNCRKVIDSQVAKALARAIEQAGIRPSQRSRRVGDYVLGKLLADGPGYQDRLAKHAAFDTVYCRVRQYTVAQAESEEERQRRKRAAAREFQIMQSLNHPNILPVLDYKENELGPALLFRYLDPRAMRFDHYLATHCHKLSSEHRLNMLRQIAGQEILRFLSELRKRFPNVEPARAKEATEHEAFGPPSLEVLHQRIIGVRNPKQDTEGNIRIGLLSVTAPESQPASLWPSQTDVAEALSTTSTKVSQVLRADRTRWGKDPQVTALRHELCEQVQRLGGVATISEVIDLTILLRPPAATLDSAQQQRLASAVARAVVETEDMMTQRRFQLRRVAGKAVVSCSQELAAYAEKLGQVADRLADLDPLASPIRVFQELYEVPQPQQPHGCLPFGNERLLKLAAAMGSRSAVSSLQEVYPCGMAAERALRLGLRALSGLNVGETEKGFSVEQVRERVRGRYPQAEPLPDRPALDALLDKVGLGVGWDAESKLYRRREQDPAPTSGSSIPQRRSTAQTARHVEATPEKAEARAYQDRLKHAYAEGGFLVLTVRPSRMRFAEAELLRRFDLQRVSFDDLLFARLREEAKELEVDWSYIEEADGTDPASQAWGDLLHLAGLAAPKITENLAQRPEHLLMVHPGLIARYDLMHVLETLRDKVGHDAPCPGLWVLVATDGQSDLRYAGDDLPALTLGQRAFEIVMARQIAKGGLETTWFERHGSTPITEIPTHWPAAYRKLVERRIKVIETNKDMALIEKPEYKRRWNTEPWHDQEQRALKNWLLDRLETPKFHKGTKDNPKLTTTAQMADVASGDAEFLQVAALYRGRPDFDVSALVAELVEGEVVPFLPILRYKPSGLRKRGVWERTWDLQRQQDAGKDVGEIPIPPKYATADFLKTDFWRLRGKLNVPKERWISYPHCSPESDPTLVVGWAGWNHLQQATALVGYYDARKREGWDAKRLTPLLAGLDQLLPWIHQWHPEIAPEFGETAGQSFQTMLGQDAHELGLTLEDIRAWEPPQKAGRQTRKARTKKG